jgi:uncharacterized protein (DUF1810 family)
VAAVAEEVAAAGSVVGRASSSAMNDPYDLERFETAQAGVYDTVLAELRAGHKTGHWMWFIFPQIAGLGMSAMSQRYAISSLSEARAYLAHPVLGPRLSECAGVLIGHTGRTAEEIFGGIDAIKLRSSMTLFARAADGESIYQEVLDRYFGGAADEQTVARL